MRRALLIACERYVDNTYSTLKYPVSDAVKLRRLLEDKRLCDFGEVNVLSNPDKADAHSAIEDLASDCHIDDLILLYFSGHGTITRDGSLALVLSDTRSSRLYSTGLPDDYIRSLFNVCKARQKIVVLDCCHSGAAGEEGFRGAAIDALDSMACQMTGTFVLTASAKFQPAFEDASHHGGVLTSCLIDAVESGEAAGSGAAVLTLSRLGEYLQREVPKRSPQQPRYWDQGGIGGTVFSKVPKRFDGTWRKVTSRKLSELHTKEVLDDDIIDEIRNAMRTLEIVDYQVWFDLIDELAQGRLQLSRFLRAWDNSPWARQSAAREATEPTATESAELAVSERQKRDVAERENAERAKRDAAERIANEKAEREAAKRLKEELAEREIAKNAADRIAKEKAALAALEKEKRDVAKRESAEKAKRDAAEQIANEKAEREAAKKLQQELAEREIAKNAADRIAKEKAERAALEKEKLDAERESAEKAKRDTAERTINETWKHDTRSAQQDESAKQGFQDGLSSAAESTEDTNVSSKVLFLALIVAASITATIFGVLLSI